MRTANNGRFLGYLEGTRQAEALIVKRAAWTKAWLADSAIAPVFCTLLADAGGAAAKPLKDSAAWEACVEPLRQKFGDARLGIGKTDLYRIVPRNLVADEGAFVFTWTQRKAELLARWRTHEDLRPFWHTTLDLSLGRAQLEKLHQAKTVSDEDFIALCREIQCWAAGPPNGKRRAPREALGLRSSEDYTDADDAPRIATIYHGLAGRAQFVPFRKGDPDGNRWLDDEPLFIRWTREDVDYLSKSRDARWQGTRYFFTAGLTYNIHARGVLLKSKLLRDCVFDASASMLCPTTRAVPAEHLLALFNSHVVSFYIKKFLNNTWHEISDLRQIPLVVPTAAQTKRIKNLVTLAFRAKRHALEGTHPGDALNTAVREVERELSAGAPTYLRPGAQLKLLATAADCLAILERAVSWEAEKLYSVEGLGPFDEF